MYAPAAGRLADLPFAAITPEGGIGVELDIFGEIGQHVVGPDSTFATTLAELTLSGKNLDEPGRWPPRCCASHREYSRPSLPALARPGASGACRTPGTIRPTQRLGDLSCS